MSQPNDFASLNNALVLYGAETVRLYYTPTDGSLASPIEISRAMFEMTAVPPWPHLTRQQTTNNNKFYSFCNGKTRPAALDDDKRVIALAFLAAFDGSAHGDNFLAARRKLFNNLFEHVFTTDALIQQYMSLKEVVAWQPM